MIKESPQKNPTKYPSGLVVTTEKGTYLIKNKYKMKMFNDRVFQSWKLNDSLGSEIALSGFLFGGIIGFRDGTLLKDISDSKIYLISENKTRHIVSPDVWTKYGLNKNDIIEVSSEEILLHKNGDILD